MKHKPPAKNVSFKEAGKQPKDGFKSMGSNGFEHTTAVTIGHRLCLRPEAVFEWAQQQRVSLWLLFQNDLGAILDPNRFLVAVINGIPIPDKGQMLTLQDLGYADLENATTPGTKAEGRGDQTNEDK